MSVIKFSMKELKAIYHALLEYENREMYAWVIDRLRYSEHQKTAVNKMSWEDYINNDIGFFVIRCGIANELAFMWSYHHDWEKPYFLSLVDITRGDIEYKPLTRRKLLDKLTSLRYNCISQGGNTHLIKVDEERLEHLIRGLQARVITFFEEWERSLT